MLKQKITDGDFFFQRQYDYVYDDEGRLLVDFVGKLERISEDIQKVFRQCGLENASLPHVNKSEKGLKRGLAALVKKPGLLGHLKVDKLFSNKKIRELSQKEKDKVFKLYSKDFEHFGYGK